eukprot:Nk52_evm9s1360 gene=Nk52_evmTU9s1360
MVQVCYCFSAKKKRNLRFDQIIAAAQANGLSITFVELPYIFDDRQPTSNFSREQRDAIVAVLRSSDVFVHKVTELQAKLANAQSKSCNIPSPTSVGVKEKLLFIQECILQLGHLKVIDPLSATAATVSRVELFDILMEKSREKSCPFEVPNYALIAPENSKMWQIGLLPRYSHQFSVFKSFRTFIRNKDETKHDLNFPILCKPNIGSGSPLSHKMLIIEKEDVLNKVLLESESGSVDVNILNILEDGAVAQEFINHDAVLWKVFVCGSHIDFVRRPSIKNSKEFLPELADGVICFSSHEISKPGCTHVLSLSGNEDLIADEATSRRLKNIALSIQKMLGLSLFGVDVIENKSTNAYVVIDVNYFPGYDGVLEFQKKFLQLFI